MGDFSAAWLQLREPIDHRSRSAALTTRVLEALPVDELGILDLACGTGSNLRYLRGQVLHFNIQNAEREKARPDPDWLLIDHDPSLIALVPAAPNVTTLQRDLASLDASLFEGRALVTGSALLDLVSHAWLRSLAARCRAHGSAALFALTYDGRMACEPGEPEDSLVRELVNRHQETDKGFGPALGPGAVSAAVDLFQAAGYDVRTAPSDWVLSCASAPDALQEQLIDGWAEAAAAIAPDRAAMVAAWRRRRLDHVASGRSRLVVGHHDLAAIPLHDARDAGLAARASAV
jgi:hypothetical protein